MSSELKANVDEPKYKLFNKVQWVLAACHLVPATIFLILVLIEDGKRDWKVPVNLHYNSWRTLEGRTAERCNKNNPCFIIPYVAQVSTYQLSLGVTSAFFSFISGTHHLLAAIRKDTYAKLIEEGVVTWRWIDYAFSSPLMFLILLILWNSPPDLKDIIFGFAVQFMIIVGGYASEVALVSYKKDEAAVIFWASCLAYLAVWGYISTVFAYSISIEDNGDPVCPVDGAFEDTNRDVPPLVYLIVGVILVLFTLFAVVHGFKVKNTYKDLKKETTLQERNKKNFLDNLRYESYYSVLSFTSKILLLALLFTGVVSRSDGTVRFPNKNSLGFGNFTNSTLEEFPDEGPDWGLYGTAIGTAGFCLIFALIFRYFWKQKDEEMLREGRIIKETNNPAYFGPELLTKLIF